VCAKIKKIYNSGAKRLINEKTPLAVRIVRKIYMHTTEVKTAKFFEMTQQAV